jgi:hypothetical protein
MEPHLLGRGFRLQPNETQRRRRPRNLVADGVDIVEFGMMDAKKYRRSRQKSEALKNIFLGKFSKQAGTGRRQVHLPSLRFHAYICIYTLSSLIL